MHVVYFHYVSNFIFICTGSSLLHTQHWYLLSVLGLCVLFLIIVTTVYTVLCVAGADGPWHFVLGSLHTNVICYYSKWIVSFSGTVHGFVYEADILLTLFIHWLFAG